MKFSEYVYEHPNRLKHLDCSDEFYETGGIDAVYVDPKRGLVDVTTMSALITLHGGPQLNDELGSLSAYLRGHGLRHPQDTPEDFADSLALLKADYKANRKTYVDRDGPLPFFVHPVTAFGFLRHHLSSSDEVYEMELQPTSIILPRHVKELILKALKRLKNDNYLAWYLAVENIRFKLQTHKVTNQEGDEKSWLSAYVYPQRLPAKYARVDLISELEMPSIEHIVLQIGNQISLPNFEPERLA